MPAGPELSTPRLLLRRWRASDRGWFAAINADPRVTEHFPAPLSRAESDALWAVERAATGAGIGFTGLSEPRFDAHFTPAVEVGWRMSPVYWGAGYATEAARAALDYGFARVGLAEVVSFTAIANVRSRAVMQRLGMTHDEADDFDHPSLTVGHRLRRHVLYRLPATRWTAAGLG